MVVLAGTGGTLLGYDNGAQLMLLLLLLLAVQALSRHRVQVSLAVWCPCQTFRR